MILNKSYHGFKLIDKHEVHEIKSMAHVFIHEKSGARLLYLKNDDDNKVFSVAFRTPPKDSTGVPHIIEHCVLSGSRKYKTKEPFMDMVKGSLKTFINAMTFSDKTIYPVASRNDKDFKNLMDVYMDSVFFPMIYEEKEIFMQEGWHYNIADKNEPITYNGVVYNEMRGAYSQPTTLLREKIGQSLFPDTTYQYSSGGNPDEIPNLSFEQFKQFHRDYYQPSNAYLYIYGDGDIDGYLKHINEEFLDHFNKKVVDTNIDVQKSFQETQELYGSYGIAQDESVEEKTYLAMNFVLGDGKDPKVHMLGEILKEVLVNSAAGPVKKALLDQGIGQDIMCSFGGGLQPYLSIIAKNAESTQKALFEETIKKTLREMVETGIDKSLLESAVNIAEYDMREATGYATKGIIYHILSMNSWLYGGHPTAMIAYDEEIKFSREAILSSYYEEQIVEKLLNNNHSSVVVLTPEKLLNENKASAVEADLKIFKESLDETALDMLIDENESLKKKQLSPDSKEAMATIPKLTVADVKPEAEIIPCEVIALEGYELIKHSMFASDIAYIEFLFDTMAVEQENIQVIALLTDLIGQVDTKQMSYGDLSNEIYKKTGGINFSTRNYVNTKKESYHPKLIVSGKVVTEKMADLMTLIQVLLKETLFDDKKRLKELLLQMKSRMEMSINNRGDSFASSRLASYYADASYYNEQLKGFEYYWFLSDLIKDFEVKSDVLIADLKAVYQKVFNYNNLIISFTGDENSFQAFDANYKKVLDVLDKTPLAQQTYAFDLKKKNEGITSSSNVQYVAQGFNFRNLGYTYKGHMQVLKAILNSEFLHDRIRAKGGAYGCGITFSDSGHVIATSYRDPKLKETLDVFGEIADFVQTLSLDKEALTKFIIGAISSMDSAMTAKGKGVLSTANYISGITQEMLQDDREAVLKATTEQLKSLSDLLRDVMKQQYYCVYGNDVTLNAHQDLFDMLIPLNR